MDFGKEAHTGSHFLHHHSKLHKCCTPCYGCLARCKFMQTWLFMTENFTIRPTATPLWPSSVAIAQIVSPSHTMALCAPRASNEQKFQKPLPSNFSAQNYHKLKGFGYRINPWKVVWALKIPIEYVSFPNISLAWSRMVWIILQNIEYVKIYTDLGKLVAICKE